MVGAKSGRFWSGSVLRCASAGVVIGLVGCASATRASDEVGSSVGARDGVIRGAMAEAGGDAIEILSHVATLSSGFFEGRAADTRGGELATQYIEFQFRGLGLRPAFDGVGAVDWRAGTSGSSYAQGFTVPGGMRLEEAWLAARGGSGEEEAYTLGTEFHPLGFSSSGMVRGPLAFAGYSIERGPDGFSSYEEGDDLTGAIALVFRFEPMDGTGASRWGRRASWSRHASLPEKMRAAEARGAAAVILVNPPGADDPRAEYLETHQSTDYSVDLSIPVVQMSPEGADRLIARVCDGCESVGGLLELANEGEGGAMTLGLGEVAMRVDLDRDNVPTANVGAILPGRGSLAGEFVVVGGHYDHLGYGHFGSRSPESEGAVHPGADDNASGIATILVVARHAKAAYEALPADAEARSVLFLAFAGEEMGLLGSEHFARASGLSSDRVAAMINLDMVGRMEESRLEVNGVGTSPMWDGLLDAAAAGPGLDLEKSPGGIGPSDHTIFYRAEVPAIHLFSGTHADYHTVRDTFETLNYTGCARIARFVGDLLLSVATAPDRMAFESTGDPGSMRGRSSSRVRLGIMPASYGEGGDPGVPVGEVFDGTSAAEGGMLKGDRIVRWGGDEIADIGAMMAKLGEHAPGDEVEIVVIRDGREVALQVVMQARVGGR